MKIVLRSAVLVTSLVTATVIGMTSANAATGFVFTGEVTIASFGTGASTGTAKLCVNGVVGSSTATCTTGYNASASFSVYEEASTCPLLGQATGTLTVLTSTGATTGGWTAHRVGPAIRILGVSGVLAGAIGKAEFVGPAGFVCGQANVKATITGWMG